jgi:hypothetical protein
MFRNTNTLEPSLGKATQQSKQLHGALKLRIYISDETRKDSTPSGKKEAIKLQKNMAAESRP